MKKHLLLRNLLNGSSHKRSNIARALGMSLPALQKKLSGELPWKLAEAYSLREMLSASDLPLEELFPPKDQVKKTRKDKKCTKHT